jgi:hypothetical protein
MEIDGKDICPKSLKGLSKMQSNEILESISILPFRGWGHVGIPAGNALQQAGREMEIDGKDICPKSLKGLSKMQSNEILESISIPSFRGWGHVGLPAGNTRQQARREMEIDGQGFLP